MAVGNLSPAVEKQSGLGASAFVRHRGPITTVAAIPGTDLALSAGYDSAVGLVDLKARSIRLLGYHDHLVNRVVTNREGTRAATCSSDYTICLWDLHTFEPERILRGHWDDVEDFAFIDVRRGVSAARDQRVYLWDLQTGAVLQVIDSHEKDVLSVACADGKIYTSGDDMTLRQWDAETGEPLLKWGPFEQETDTCAIDPVHGRAILGADDGMIRLFDCRTGTAAGEIAAHRSGIKKVAVSSVNGDILSAAYDQKILVWDAENFDRKIALETHPATWERSLNWTPDGKRILAGSFDGTVLVWDAATGRLLDEIGDQSEANGNACLNDVSANANGDLAVVSDDGYVRVGRLTPAAASWSSKIAPRSGRLLMNAVTRDDASGRVLAGAHDHKLHIFRIAGGTLTDEVELTLGEGPINCIRVARNPGREGEAFVACYSHAIVRVSPEAEVLGKIGVHEGAVKALALHPREEIGVSCGADNLLLTWDFQGHLLQKLPGHMAIVDDVDIDPSATWVASVSRDFTLKVYELKSGRLAHSVGLGHQSPKSMLFWDDQTVIVGNYWGYLIRVDLASGKVTRARISQNGISSVCRGGEHVMASSYDGRIYLVEPSGLEVAGSLTAMTQRVTGETILQRM